MEKRDTATLIVSLRPYSVIRLVRLLIIGLAVGNKKAKPAMKSGIKKVQVSCNNCGSSDTDFVTEGVEHEYKDTTDDVFTVVKCKHCGLHYLNPRPDVSELATIYPLSYYAYHLQQKSTEGENTNSILYKARKWIYLSRLTKALSFCKGCEGGELKVLDIGCADGRALNWYRQIEKYKVATFGVDFDPIAVEKARQAGHEVFEGRFEEADIPCDFFDLAVATHVIEHVADPREFARKAFSVLKPGGVFLIETPNIDSPDARWLKKRHWGGYHFPRHWVFYTPESLSAMVASLGFAIEQVSYHPAPAFWNWSFHSLLSSVSGMQTVADTLFPPVDFQKNNLKNLIAASMFTGIDVTMKAVAGSTSNMSLVLRKPRSV